MRFNATIAILIIGMSLFGLGCSKETVDPNLTGSLTGKVQQVSNGKPVAFASITTNPGTDAILTDTAGTFSIDHVPVGGYTIQAEKDGFKSKVVRVMVREHQTTHATIPLKKNDEQTANAFITAEVTNFFNTSSNDSSFAEIDYLVRNTSSNKRVPKFNVTFKIYTPLTIFYAQIKGDSLDSGQEAVGSIVKYIRKTSADSVVVSDVYAPTT